MNTCGQRVMDHWQKWLPNRYAQIKDPISFFTSVGEEIEERVLQISGAVPVPAGARQRIETNLEAIRVMRSMRDSDTDLTPTQREILIWWTS